jgi:hypothetical protein
MAQAPPTLRTLLASLLVGAVLLRALTFAHGAGGTIDVGAIKPGMRGYGLTVLQGTVPERFDVEVIDVLHKFRPDQDLILVRTSHPRLDKALVVGGMSGSPVYLDGKLAGAYAYGWTFGSEPVVGVTPIANMLAELARPVDPSIWKALGTLPKLVSAAARRSNSNLRLAGLPPYLGHERTDAMGPLRAHAIASGYGARSDEQAGLSPAATPIMLAGFDERVARVLNADLDRFGLIGLQASGGQATAPAHTPTAHFVDGGSIGVQLVRGDISATAIGTVTHVEGTRLVAFGHPMMNAGQPALPTTTARVLHILASINRSFKIAEATTPLGTLIHDRQAAIVVDTTLRADTIPVAVRVHGVTGASRDTWNVEVASQRMLTPMLTFGAVLNALSVTAGEQSDVMFEATSKVRVAGHGSIDMHDFGYAPVGVGNPMALSQIRLFDVLAAAYGNPFEDARIEQIEVDLNVRFAHDVLTIVDALVPSTEVDPDRDLNVYLTLQRFGEREQTRVLPVHIPATAAGEKIELVFEPGDVVKQELPEPRSLDDLFRNIRTTYPATSLIVSTKMPSQGLRLRGHVVSGLPGSALDSLQLTGEGDRPVSFPTHVRTEVPMHDVLDGSARISLDVRREPLR